MAEVAGLGFSSVQLLSLFQTCLSFYDQIESLKHKKDDLKYFALKLSVERYKLSQLCDRLDDDYLEAGRQKLVRQILENTQITLERLSKNLQYHLGSFDENGQRVKGGNKLTRSFTWVARDQQTIEQMLSRLKELNTDLETLLSVAQLASLKFGLIAHSIASTDVGELRLVQTALKEERPAISTAAIVKALRIENLSGIQNSGLPPPSSQIVHLDSFKWASSRTTIINIKSDASLSDIVERERALARFTLAQTSPAEEISVLVEWRTGFKSTSSTEARRYRLDQLVCALSQMSSMAAASPTSPLTVGDGQDDRGESISFGVLQCLGWLTTDREFSHIGLVFCFPNRHLSNPKSLHERIKADRRPRGKTTVPALGTRFSMALQLVQRIANLIVVGWVHKSMRSHNVLMFEGPPDSDNSTTQNTRDGTKKKRNQELEQLYVTGFSYARPGDPDEAAGEMSTLPTSDPTYALYRPPNSIQDNYSLDAYGDVVSPDLKPSLTTRLDATFDIYGLGIILLEIGLWKTIDVMYEESRTRYRSSRDNKQNHPGPSNPLLHGAASDAGGGGHPPSPAPALTLQEFQESPVLSQLVDSLEPRVGAIYRDAVRKCLLLDGGRPSRQQADGEEDGDNSKSPRGRHQVEFLKIILASLSQCKA